MEHEHIITAYDEELAQLEKTIAQMGGLVESQLAGAIEAITTRDTDRAQQMIDLDKQVDELETQVDALTMRLIALRQPMGDDLRAIIAGLKASNDLERIGDYAKNIAKRAITLSQTPPIGEAGSAISRMGRSVQIMIKIVLDAYIGRDEVKARDVLARDEEVDQLNTSLFRELLTYMMEDPRNITACTHLIFIAKNIERMGDHATNIAEYIIFMIRGNEPVPNRPKDDNSPFTVVTPKVTLESVPEKAPDDKTLPKATKAPS